MYYKFRFNIFFQKYTRSTQLSTLVTAVPNDMFTIYITQNRQMLTIFPFGLKTPLLCLQPFRFMWLTQQYQTSANPLPRPLSYNSPRFNRSHYWQYSRPAFVHSAAFSVECHHSSPTSLGTILALCQVVLSVTRRWREASPSIYTHAPSVPVSSGGDTSGSSRWLSVWHFHGEGEGLLTRKKM